MAKTAQLVVSFEVAFVLDSWVAEEQIGMRKILRAINAIGCVVRGGNDFASICYFFTIVGSNTQNKLHGLQPV